MARLEVVSAGERERREKHKRAQYQRDDLMARQFGSLSNGWARMKAHRIRKVGGSGLHMPAFDEGKCGIYICESETAKDECSTCKVS